MGIAGAIQFSRNSEFSEVFRNKESFARRNGIAKTREKAKKCENRYCWRNII